MDIKMLFLFPLLILLLSAKPSGEVSTLPEQYDGMVILHIKGLDDATHDKMQKAVSNKVEIGIEYVCVETGIVVVKFSNSTMAAKGDNEVLVREQFKGSVPKGSMGTIFVEVYASSGSSKC